MLCLPALKAQRVIEPYFIHIPPERFGASQCYSQYFDSNGGLWFASDNGLKYYNGYTVKTYAHIPGDTNSMLHNHLNTFFKDKYGKFWLGYTTVPGITRFDPEKNKFEHFHPDSTRTDAVPEAMVVRFKEDEKGRLWILMWDGGLINIDHKTGRCKKIYQRNFDNPADTLGILGNRIKAMYPLGNDEYLLGFFSGGAFAPWPMVFNPNTGTFKKFPVEEYMLAAPKYDLFKIEEAFTIVHDIYRDRNGNFWFACYSGLVFVDMKNKVAKRVTGATNVSKGRNLENTRGFMEDEHGRLWVPTSTTGIMIVDINTREVISIKQADDRESGLADNRVGSMAKDRDGNIWFSGGMGGFSIYVPFLQQFPLHYWSRMNLEYTNRSAQESPANFFELMNKDTLAVSSENGISYYSLSLRKLVDQYKPEFRIEPNEKPAPLVSYFFHRENRIFFNYKDRVKITGINPRNEVQYPGKKSEKWDMVVSGQDKRIPILFRYGLSRDKEAPIKQYDIKSNQFTPFRSFPFTVRSNTVRWMSDSTWLMGAGNRGFCVYNHITDKLLMFSCDSTGSTYFPDSTINRCYAAPDGLVWLVTNNGVYTMNIHTGKWQLLNKNFALKPDEIVSGLAFDEKGMIWFTADKNLVRYNPANKSLLYVNKFLDFSLGTFEGSNTTDSAGRIYFGTNRGVLIIDPNQFHLPSRKPVLLLSSCSVNKIKLSREQSKQLATATPAFAWNENNLVFEVQTDQLFSLRPNRFYYRLKGLDTVWTDNGTSNQIRLTNLSHGSYELEIMAVNGFEIESKTLALRFLVNRPFWKTWWFITLIALVALSVVYTLIKLRERSLRKKQEELEAVIQERTAEVVAKAREIEVQKDVIEEKNKELTDSIHYAQRIQQSILPEETFMCKHLKEHFVYFRPKDIVSGDFYWFTFQKDSILWAVVDCTGHGVPGGFMSMLGAGLLNQIVNEEQKLSPDDILNQLRKRVIIALKQTGADGESRDGMDISLCHYIPAQKKLEFAGANNSLYVVKNNTLTELKADKQPIGIYIGNVKPFTLHTLELNKGDQLYMTSDGYSDQFGGIKGKKFKSSSFEKLLTHIHAFAINEQRNTIENTFTSWKGDYEQLDDVCVMGVKIS
ncbi:MAG: two-component regulator propeller domain-containing protein [Flavobacteriales bacterium]